MQHSLSKLFITVIFSAAIIRCNDADKKDTGKKTKQEDTTATNTTAPPAPPATEPPGVLEMMKSGKKCFINEGLKYKTIITLSYDSNRVAGYVVSEELDGSNKNRAPFKGTVSGDKFTIKFEAGGPVIGDASEWTDKPWKVVKPKNGKEKMLIVFNAKNYETNKWSETLYEFEASDCQ